MKTYKRVISLTLCLLMCFMSLCVNAVGSGDIDLSQNVELNIFFEDEDTAVVGAEFNIIKAFDVDAKGNYTLTSQFSVCSVDAQANMSNPEVLAYTLSGYAHYKGIEALDTDIVDSNGVAHFPNSQQSLDAGIYLIMPEVFDYNNARYTVDPFLVALPGEDEETGEWLYSVNVVPKFSKGENPVNIDVVKVWDDEEYSGDRPDSVTVYLLKDYEIYETVELSDDNEWSYSWEDLDSQYYWNVMEVFVGDYTYSVDKQEETVVLTNTYEGTPPETTEPPTVPDDPDLPQTGIPWWPVPLLVAGGLVLVIVGFILRRGRKNEE